MTMVMVMLEFSGAVLPRFATATRELTSLRFDPQEAAATDRYH